MIRIRILALAALLSPAVLAQQVPASLPADATLLQVDAQGQSQRAPDVATVEAGVVSRDANADVAMRANSARMQAVVAALKQAGVAARDLQTADISLQPQYVYANDQPPKINGYEVRNSIRIRLRDMAKVGAVLDTLVRQGANQINGPSFSVDKPEAALDEARRDAIAKARARAQVYAQAAGLKVRRIVSISENGEVSRPPRPMMQMMAAREAAAAPPVQAGETTLGVSVNVQFELGR